MMVAVLKLIIYNSVHHTSEYNQLQNRSNHFDTPGISPTKKHSVVFKIVLH